MSDSSSDENDERLREAAVTVNDIFAKKQGQKKSQESVLESTGSSGDAGTTITDLSTECRQFLAKSLSNTLDKKIKLVDKPLEIPDKENSTGIKLFTDSTVHLVEIEEPQVQRPRKKHKKSKEKITDDMLAAIAVTPEWVLQQSGIQGAKE
uniref:Protein CUSTOS n=1 Tax=Rhipicephalus microplus TaxID=6941 RepID=A0A6G5AE19_RHIMP